MFLFYTKTSKIFATVVLAKKDPYLPRIPGQEHFVRPIRPNAFQLIIFSCTLLPVGNN